MIKKKLLILLDNYLPPSQTFVYDQLVELSRYYTCIVATIKATRKELPSGVEIRIISENTWFQYFRKRMQQRDIFSSFFSYDINRQFQNLLSEINPDGILVHFGTTAAIFSQSILASQLDTFIYFHGHDASGMISKSNSYRKKVESLLNFDKTHPLIVSNGLKLQFVNAIKEAEKCKVKYLGVPVDRIQVKKEGYINMKRRFVIVGRLVPKKGHQILFKAFQQLCANFPEYDYSLDIVGDGPEREPLIILAKELRIDHFLKFHGTKSVDWVYNKLLEADIFVLPSHTFKGDAEGLPISILEAMASNLPVISTNHSGIPEAVIDHTIGILVKENDSKSLANAMYEVCSNHHIGQGARNLVENKFNLVNRVFELSKYIDHVLSHNNHLTKSFFEK
jgi:colanic acid/amylovoran biosynthesis glycosyltransferase